ncbi:MAG: hypothetical protein IBJ11_10230 [Phycisphaerales bacterium]|nr:hypothetical protein [Phycisphaerales bacterium]
MPGQLWLLSLSPPVLAVAHGTRALPQIPVLWRSKHEPDVIMTVAYFYGVWLISDEDLGVTVESILFNGELIEMPTDGQTLRDALELARRRM